eukprot:scaffold10141_cov60-Cyclotella_meneghiniana.AAC.4
MKLSHAAKVFIVVASATTGNGQASPKTASAHDVARDKSTVLKTKLMRGGDVSLRSDAKSTETAQLLQLVKDLAEQVEDMKTELLVQKDYVKTISPVLNVENIITELDAEIARVAEKVYESHVPPPPKPPQDDPSAEGPPGVSPLELSDASTDGLGSGQWTGLGSGQSTGIGSGQPCLRGLLYRTSGKNAYYYNAWDDAVNWSRGCNKCVSNDTTGAAIGVLSSSDRISFWYKCA